MANFKRALGGSADGGGILDMSSGTGDLVGHMGATYWPLLLAGVLLLILVLRGEARAVLPVLGFALLLQAWRSGMFG
jgi:hypothetical protein